MHLCWKMLKEIEDNCSLFKPQIWRAHAAKSSITGKGKFQSCNQYPGSPPKICRGVKSWHNSR